MSITTDKPQPTTYEIQDTRYKIDHFLTLVTLVHFSSLLTNDYPASRIPTVNKKFT